MSADLGLTEGNLTEAASVQVLLSDLKGFHVSSEAPQSRAHRAFQNPTESGKLGRGLPVKAQSSSCAPAVGSLQACRAPPLFPLWNLSENP